MIRSSLPPIYFPRFLLLAARPISLQLSPPLDSGFYYTRNTFLFNWKKWFATQAGTICMIVANLTAIAAVGYLLHLNEVHMYLEKRRAVAS
jgi:hypothetical protein